MLLIGCCLGLEIVLFLLIGYCLGLEIILFLLIGCCLGLEIVLFLFTMERSFLLEIVLSCLI